MFEILHTTLPQRLHPEQQEEKNDRPTLKALGLEDLLDIVLYNDHLKSFNQSWSETLMAQEKEPAQDLLESHHESQLEKR